MRDIFFSSLVVALALALFWAFLWHFLLRIVYMFFGWHLVAWRLGNDGGSKRESKHEEESKDPARGERGQMGEEDIFHFLRNCTPLFMIRSSSLFPSLSSEKGSFSLSEAVFRVCHYSFFARSLARSSSSSPAEQPSHPTIQTRPIFLLLQCVTITAYPSHFSLITLFPHKLSLSRR